MTHKTTKQMKGEIRYTMWTVAGDVILEVSYEISETDDLEVGIVKIKGKCPRPDEDTMQEIAAECMQDYKRRQKEKPSDKLTKIPGTDWGMN